MRSNKSYEYWRADITRYGGKRTYATIFLFWFRKAQFANNIVVKYFSCLIARIIGNKHGLEISWRTKIGKGLYIGRPYNISINPNAVLEDNCNIHKGIVIGQTNRGDKKVSRLLEIMFG